MLVRMNARVCYRMRYVTRDTCTMVLGCVYIVLSHTVYCSQMGKDIKKQLGPGLGVG